MTKIGLITDTHYGCRNDNIHFYDYFRKSNDYCFDTFKQNGVENIIHLGDVYDRRTSTNTLTGNICWSDLIFRLSYLYKTDIIVGNHDCYYNNSNFPNTVRLLNGGLNNVMVHDSPTQIVIDDVLILLLPWINSENRLETMNMIASTKAQICFGHLSIQGFIMDMGRVNEDGLSPKVFEKFDFVASGHFHTRSSIGNIHYLGAHCEFSWADFNDPRGFSIFDLETRELEFFQNPYRMFDAVVFDDWNLEKINETDYSYYKDKYIRIVVNSKPNQYLFDIFLAKMYDASCIDISVIESTTVTENTHDMEASTVSDTPSILNTYVDGLQTTLEVPRLKGTLRTIYDEAKVLEDNR